MLQRLTTSLAYLRPRALARSRKTLDDLVAETRDLRNAVRLLTEQHSTARSAHSSTADSPAGPEDIRRELSEIREILSGLARHESQLRAIARADALLDRYIDDLPTVLNGDLIAGHVRAAIDGARLLTEPFPHVVVDNLLPGKFYDALIRGLPPVELFDGHVNKQQVPVPMAMGPAYSRRVWRYMATVVANRIVAPAVGEKFRAPLAEWMSADWPALADPLSTPIDLHASEGRIMLRGRGYHIPPHRDPKWGFITCLMYLARRGDDEAWGTVLYDVEGDEEARGTLPHWITPERCRVVSEVPFRPNSALIFLNSKGAHGASIPDDAEPADLQRYAYQFRIGPTRAGMGELMAALPAERAAAWSGTPASY